jgi:hypothetical protein
MKVKIRNSVAAAARAGAHRRIEEQSVQHESIRRPMNVAFASGFSAFGAVTGAFAVAFTMSLIGCDSPAMKRPDRIVSEDAVDLPLVGSTPEDMKIFVDGDALFDVVSARPTASGLCSSGRPVRHATPRLVAAPVWSRRWRRRIQTWRAIRCPTARPSGPT